MPTNKYDAPLNSAAVFALTVPAALYSFVVLLNLFLLWLSPFSMLILVIFLFTGQASTRLYYAAELFRRIRRGPDLALSNGGVGLTPMIAPIKLVTADFIQLAAMFPLSLVACALTHSPVLSSASSATGGAVSTVTIAWDRMPYLAGIDLVTVKRDSTKKARITTTGSPAPTTIDITCLDLTPAQLQRLIGCFACRPQYRGVLATDGGVTLVRALIDDKPAGWPA